MITDRLPIFVTNDANSPFCGFSHQLYTNLSTLLTHAEQHFTTVIDRDEVEMQACLQTLCEHIHGLNVAKGWWTELATGQPLKRNVGEMLMLVVSEVAEAMEGHRKNLQDDKLPQFKMFDVELADANIRIFDIAGGIAKDFAESFVAKVSFNFTRADHDPANRAKADGKKY